MTIGDFAAAANLFVYVYNDSLGCGALFTDKGKKVVKEHKLLQAWVDNQLVQHKSHLDSRPPASF